jgi:hypothetical protein
MVSCLGLVFLLMGPLLLVAAWINGRSLVLALGSLAYVVVGAWVLSSYRKRSGPP